MKITETKTVTFEQTLTIDTECNRCGKSCKGKYDTHGLTDYMLFGSDDSPFFSDGDVFKFDICEECLVEWFKSFKTNPLSHNVNNLPT